MRHLQEMLAAVLIMSFSLRAADHIHFGSTGNPLNGRTITWHSANPNDSIKWGYTSSFEKGSFPGTRRTDYSGYLYDYRFPVLSPKVTIHYAIKDGSWSTGMTYTTGNDSARSEVVFIGMADSRSYPSNWESISTHAATRTADLVVFPGDVTESGGSVTQWNDWYSHGEAFLKKFPVYYSPGNHDYGNINWYYNQFVQPGALVNERYYSFEYGNVLFVSLNTEEQINPTQTTWVTGLLKNSTRQWKVLFFHRPFFVTGGHVGEMDSHLGTWWKAFDDYGVDVIINGHTHHYERTKPINRNVSTSQPVTKYGSGAGEGRLQIIAGRAGAPANGCSAAWFQQKCTPDLNYALFSINGGVLRMSAYNERGDLLDSLTIVKGSTAAAGTAIPRLSNGRDGIRARYSRGRITVVPDLAGPVDLLLCRTNGARVLRRRLENCHSGEEVALEGSVPAGTYLLSVRSATKTVSHVLAIE